MPDVPDGAMDLTTGWRNAKIASGELNQGLIQSWIRMSQPFPRTFSRFVASITLTRKSINLSHHEKTALRIETWTAMDLRPEQIRPKGSIL